jgi:hypothetical protein
MVRRAGDAKMLQEKSNNNVTFPMRSAALIGAILTT